MNSFDGQPDSNSSSDDFEIEDIYSRELIPFKKKRREYDTQDRKLMMKYMLANNRMNQIGSRSMWIEMEQKKILPGRTWQSLKEHFVKKLLPFHLHELSLKDSDLEFIFKKVPSAKVSYEAIANKKKNYIESRRLAHEAFLKKISPTRPVLFVSKQHMNNEANNSEAVSNVAGETSSVEDNSSNKKGELNSGNNEELETPVNNISDSSDDSASTVLFESPPTNPSKEPSLETECLESPTDISNMTCNSTITENEIFVLDPPLEQPGDVDKDVSDCSQQNPNTEPKQSSSTEPKQSSSTEPKQSSSTEPKQSSSTEPKQSSSTEPIKLKEAVVLLERLPVNEGASTSCSPTTTLNTHPNNPQTKNISANTNPADNRSRRIPFSLEEDLCILEFIINNNRQNQIGGNTLWQDLEAEKMDILKNRSWQSLKERYKKRILPKLKEYPLDEEDVRLLGG